MRKSRQEINNRRNLDKAHEAENKYRAENMYGKMGKIVLIWKMVRNKSGLNQIGTIRRLDDKPKGKIKCQDT